MPTPKSNESPTTFQQLLRILRTESPLFPFTLAKNATSWAWAKYVLQKRSLTRTIHGHPMSLDLWDNGISRSLLLVGDREREHRFMLEHALQPGQTVLDIGANIGYYVFMELDMVGPTGRVIAIEPSPRNVERLQHNIRLNKSPKNVFVHHAALSEKSGSTTLHLSTLSNVHSLIKENTPSATGSTIQVPAMTLSELIQRYGKIDLLRMDIEGYEQNILRSLLHQETTYPDILMELHPSKYDNELFSQLLIDLKNHGYKVRLLASSHSNKLMDQNCEIIASIATDGTIRHIAKNVSMDAFKQLYANSRAVLLSTSIHS